MTELEKLLSETHISTPEVYGCGCDLDLNALACQLQEVLPTVYGEQLSYYEVLCKLVYELIELEKKVDELGGGDLIEALQREVANIWNEIGVAKALITGAEERLGERIDGVVEEQENLGERIDGVVAEQGDLNGRVGELEKESEVASEVELGEYESNGVIVEKYADGREKTYMFDFDAEGRPTKITDSDGNETVLNWGGE